MLNPRYIFFVILIFSSCSYGVNKENSQIGDLNSKCLDANTWDRMTEIYAFDDISDLTFLKGLYDIEEHFIKPEYVLYFDDLPKELIGCDSYSIHAVYNPEISEDVLDGLSLELSDKEQIRIRNRVQKALMEFQCEEGKKESTEWMKRPAIYSEEFYNQ